MHLAIKAAKRLLASLALVCALGIAVAQAPNADTLVIGVGVDPVCMDPPFLAGLTADSLATQIYSRLGWRSEPDMTPVLWAAESVEQIEPLVWR